MASPASTRQPKCQPQPTANASAFIINATSPNHMQYSKCGVREMAVRRLLCTGLPAVCLPACLPAHLPTCLPAFLLACCIFA